MSYITRVAVLAALLPLGVQAQAGQVVGPGGTSVFGNPTPWTPWVAGGAGIEVTTTQPRVGFGGYGDGSLQMSVSGVRRDLGQGAFDYPDWAFWYTYAGGAYNSGQSYGTLSELSALSFDWFRAEPEGSNWNAGVGTGEQPINPLDWAYKTPVVRLQLRETRGEGAEAIVSYSELVWEDFFNKCLYASTPGCDNDLTPVNTWVSQTGMQNDNFWYVQPSAFSETGSPLPLNPLCQNNLSFWSGGVVSTGAGSLLSTCFAGAQVDIIGIAVGVGSQWPLPYQAFVDNVQMGFGANQTLAVNANFDFVPVPEPSSLALLAAGLVSLGAAARRRAR